MRLLAVAATYLALLGSMVVYEGGVPRSEDGSVAWRGTAATMTWDYTATPWSASVDAEQALGDSLLRFPGAVGWGASAISCQDSLRAGTGEVRVWRVTEATGTGAGTYRAAWDSAAAHSAANTCQYIVFPNGGTFTFSSDPNYDGIQNLRITGATAQGEGANLGPGAIPRHRNSDNVTYEYLYSRRMGEGASAFGSSSSHMCSRGLYFRHLSASWSSLGGGHNLITIGCGTEAVPMTGSFSRNHTIQGNLLFEPDSLHSTFVHVGGWHPEGGVNKQARTLMTENYMASGGQRTPLFGNTDSISSIRDVVYNKKNSYGQIRSSRFLRSRVDQINGYYRPGPMTSSGALRRRAMELALMDPLDDDSTTIHMAGLRTEQNNYDHTQPAANLHRGPQRTSFCRSSVNTVAGMCEADGDSIPLSFVASDTMPTAWTARAEVSMVSITDTERDRIIQTAGYHRYLQCSGEWALRSDSVDVRARTEWQDSIGAAEWVGANTDRSYGTPASGTACADADADGLPDAYETAQCGTATCLNPDSMSFHRPAIEWYLDGRNLDGTLVGFEAAASTFFPATDSAFNVYRLLRVPQFFVSGGGVDTFQFRAPHPDTIGRTRRYQFHTSCQVGDTTLISTRDTLALKDPLTPAEIEAWRSTHSLATGAVGCDTLAILGRRGRIAWVPEVFRRWVAMLREAD